MQRRRNKRKTSRRAICESVPYIGVSLSYTWIESTFKEKVLEKVEEDV